MEITCFLFSGVYYSGSMPQSDGFHPLTFTGCYDRIEKIVDRKCRDWNLTINPSIDKDDVKQIILKHINFKFTTHYDQSRNLEAWTAVVSENQFTNELRNNYLSTATPCSSCPSYLNNNLCKTFGYVSSECRLYADWLKSKQYRHSCRMPISIESKLNEVNNITSDFLDYDSAIKNLNNKILPLLTPSEREIYTLSYIEGKSDEEVSKILGFKTSENNRTAGYARLAQLRLKASKIAKRILQEDGIEYD